MYVHIVVYYNSGNSQTIPLAGGWRFSLHYTTGKAYTTMLSLYQVIPDYTYTVYIVMQALPTWRLQACTNLTKSSDVSIVVSTNPN